MKYIIYHRYPSYHRKEEIDAILKILDDYIFNYTHDRTETEVILEEANNLLAQQKLGSLIANLKEGKSTPTNTIVVCYDLISFVSDAPMIAIKQLSELQYLAQVIFYSQGSSKELADLTDIIATYIREKSWEKERLLAFRVAKNGQSYGRPLISVDIEKATKLRSEGLSYQEISNRMGQSLSLIYSKLPKEVKVKYRKLRYERVGRPRKQL
jgi:DNA invertase Pin-like site-specific DNA recombinase